MSDKISSIIVSDAKAPMLRRFTESMVANLAPLGEVFVVESTEGVAYTGGAVTIEAPKPFNYNRALNRAIQFATGDYLALLNNDLLPFDAGPHWLLETISQMKANKLDSASPWCIRSHPQMGIKSGTGVHVGTKLFEHVCGWAIVLTRDALERIGGRLPEVVAFWYSDDAYIEALREKKLRHGLVTSARLDHIGSQTLHTLPKKEQNGLTHGQTLPFCKTYGYKTVEDKNKFQDEK